MELEWNFQKEHHLKIGLTTTGTNQVEVIKKALDVLIDGNKIFDVFQITYNFLDQSLREISDELICNNKTIISVFIIFVYWIISQVIL